MNFKGGSYEVEMTDGNIDSIFFCNDPNYFPPGFYRGLCSPGTSGFLTAGNINGASIQRPYLVIKTLNPAFVVEPFKPQFVTLNAAPASALPRPSSGFKDDSATLYYNLNTTDIQEYKITRYIFNRTYNKTQRERFKSEVVPGVYQYVFPTYVAPGAPFAFRPVSLSSTIFPMVEGYAEINRSPQGVEFTQVNENKWNKDGFVELSYLRPNIIRWAGMRPTNVYSSVDKLYFSLKALVEPADPENSKLVETPTIFPEFETRLDLETGEAPKLLLSSPYVTQYTLAPIFPSGTRAMVELNLERDLQNSAISHDSSTRKFQIPVIVMNRYSDYVSIDLAKTSQNGILSDPDKDGHNNLTEWILGSNGADRGSIPTPPTPAPYQAVTIIGTPTIFGSYFGFNVDVQKITIPKVKYYLQRSLDRGKTWQPFETGYYLTDGSFSETAPVDTFGFILPYNWSVQKVATTVRGVTSVEYQVRSGIRNTAPSATIPTMQPPGTLSDLYRVKIVLKD